MTAITKTDLPNTDLTNTNRPADCPAGCAFRIRNDDNSWRCLTCQQLWDRSENGAMTWTREQQAQHREIWAQALESLQYRQGRKVLRQKAADRGADLFCCLGVGTDICPHVQWDSRQNDYFAVDNQHGHKSNIQLVPTVQNWLGVREPHAPFDKLPDHKGLMAKRINDNNLTHLNDSNNTGFPTIAQIIRSNPPGMFR